MSLTSKQSSVLNLALQNLVSNSTSSDNINVFFLQSVLYLFIVLVGTLSMAILHFQDVEHPKTARFAPGIRNQIF